MLRELAALLIAVTAAAGQRAAPESPPAPASRAPDPLPEHFDPAVLGLSPDPLVIESLGLEMHLPADTHVLAERTDNQVSLTVRPIEGAWTLRIQPLATRQPDGAAVIDDHLRRIDAAGLSHTLIDRRPFTCRGATGHLCYVEQVGNDGQAYATGWLVVPRGEGQMLMFALLVPRAELAALRPRIETSFATIGVLDAETVAVRRTTRLLEGQKVLDGLTPMVLQQLVGLDQWFRVHHPADAATGSTGQEIGYSHVQVREAPRGALEPERSERDYDAIEREPGLLVEIRGRISIDPAADAYFDSIGLYWTAWDRSAEAWSVRTTHRTGERTQTESETGVRPRASAGDPAPTLTVVRSTAGSFSREPFAWPVPPVYLEHALTWVFGRLLPRDGSIEGDYAVYTYRGAGGRPAVTLRQDAWSRDAAGEGWTLRSRPSSDEPATISHYDADGRLLRRIAPDGVVTEPSTLESLRRRWSNAGLRVGRTERIGR